MAAAAPRRVAQFGFYIAFAGLAATVWGIQYYMEAATAPPSGTILSSWSPNSNPNQWQQMGFQAISETNRLLTTLGTALLGALGLVLGDRAKNRTPHHLWSAFLSAMSTCLSLYYGYVGHLNLLTMIYSENFDPYSPAYLLPSHLQFYTLLVGVFLLAGFVFYNLRREV